MPSEVITLMTFINNIINTKLMKQNATSTGIFLTAYGVYFRGWSKPDFQGGGPFHQFDIN